MEKEIKIGSRVQLRGTSKVGTVTAVTELGMFFVAFEGDERSYMPFSAVMLQVIG